MLSEPSPGYSSDNGFFKLFSDWIFIDVSEDAQLRFEEELAKVSAERDAIEKAHLTLLEERNQLKTQAVSL